MKVLDLAGAQRLWNAMTARMDAAAAPAGSMASWHTLDGIADSYDMGGESDIAAWLAANLNLSANGRLWAVAAPRSPALEVGPYTWQGPTADIRMVTSADVTLRFPDGSSLSKSVAFTSDYNLPGRVYAAQLENATAVIDTGLTMDYGCRYVFTGHASSASPAVIVGAFSSTAERATLRILGNSNKAQSMWPGNIETTSTASGINFREMFTADIDASRTVFTQGATTYTRSYSGTASGTGTAPIYLLNETPGGGYGYGTLREARIYAADGTLLRCFQAANVEGEIVLMDLAHDNQIYRPSAGGLVEVTA